MQQMSAAARDRALAWFEEVRGRGGLVAFSANHRAVGWDATEDAALEASRFSSAADVVFASATDCWSLFGDDEPEAALDRLTGFGPSEAVLTTGAAGARLRTDHERVDVPDPVPVYLTYFTVAPSPDGVVFRPDRYNRDQKLLARVKLDADTQQVAAKD